MIPKATGKRIATHKVMWSARDFTYDEEAREIILRQCAPLRTSRSQFEPLKTLQLQWMHQTSGDLLASPHDVCVGMIQMWAREALQSYLAHPVKPSITIERKHLTEVAEAADRLRRLLADEPWEWPFPGFPHELASLANRYSGRAEGIEKEFDHPIFGVRDPIRFRLALRTLSWQMLETGKNPGNARDSRAARLLIAAVNPVMELARNTLHAKAARDLNGSDARYLIQKFLSGHFNKDGFGLLQAAPLHRSPRGD